MIVVFVLFCREFECRSTAREGQRGFCFSLDIS